MAPDFPALCAVVPAAGKGARLGLDVPKVFVPLFPSCTVWEAIHGKLAQVAERIVLVLSPEGSRFVTERRGEFGPESFAKTVVALQPQPLGMGDAIFGAADLWREAGSLLVIWGDQFNVSLETLRAGAALHAAQTGPAVVLPVVRMPRPYVEYRFDSADRLVEVRQSREGEACEPGGFADVGVFFLTGGQVLCDAWEEYRRVGDAGTATGEVNFLPFLVHLSVSAGWPVVRHEGCRPDEALGINTPEDLAAARRILSEDPGFRDKFLQS